MKPWRSIIIARLSLGVGWACYQIATRVPRRIQILLPAGYPSVVVQLAVLYALHADMRAGRWVDVGFMQDQPLDTVVPSPTSIGELRQGGTREPQ